MILNFKKILLYFIILNVPFLFNLNPIPQSKALNLIATIKKSKFGNNWQNVIDYLNGREEQQQQQIQDLAAEQAARAAAEAEIDRLQVDNQQQALELRNIPELRNQLDQLRERPTTEDLAAANQRINDLQQQEIKQQEELAQLRKTQEKLNTKQQIAEEVLRNELAAEQQRAQDAEEARQTKLEQTLLNPFNYFIGEIHLLLGIGVKDIPNIDNISETERTLKNITERLKVYHKKILEDEKREQEKLTTINQELVEENQNLKAQVQQLRERQIDPDKLAELQRQVEEERQRTAAERLVAEKAVAEEAAQEQRELQIELNESRSKRKKITEIYKRNNERLKKKLTNLTNEFQQLQKELTEATTNLENERIKAEEAETERVEKQLMLGSIEETKKTIKDFYTSVIEKLEATRKAAHLFCSDYPEDNPITHKKYTIDQETLKIIRGSANITTLEEMAYVLSIQLNRRIINFQEITDEIIVTAKNKIRLQKQQNAELEQQLEIQKQQLEIQKQQLEIQKQQLEEQQ